MVSTFITISSADACSSCHCCCCCCCCCGGGGGGGGISLYSLFTFHLLFLLSLPFLKEPHLHYSHAHLKNAALNHGDQPINTRPLHLFDTRLLLVPFPQTADRCHALPAALFWDCAALRYSWAGTGHLPSRVSCLVSLATFACL